MTKRVWNYQTVSNTSKEKFDSSIYDLAEQGFVITNFNVTPVRRTGVSNGAASGAYDDVLYTALLRRAPETPPESGDSDPTGGTPVGARTVIPFNLNARARAA